MPRRQGAGWLVHAASRELMIEATKVSCGVYYPAAGMWPFGVAFGQRFDAAQSSFLPIFSIVLFIHFGCTVFALMPLPTCYTSSAGARVATGRFAAIRD